MEHELKELEHEVSVITDDSIQEMLLLASRLREQAGGELDDSAILAVAEATGAPVDYVRLAVRTVPTETKQTPIERIKSSFLAFDPDIRRYVMAGTLATITGLAAAFPVIWGPAGSFMGTLAILLGLGAVWNCAVGRSVKSGAISGAIYGALAFLAYTLFLLGFSFLPQVRVPNPESGYLFLFAPLGAFVGVLSQRILSSSRTKLGMRDPATERHEMLQQLLEIQDKLRSDERFVTFMSVDIVGSTQIKAQTDPLAAEFTFNEYHKFVAAIAARHGGRIHSTAGDGVTCAFEQPIQGLAAGKALLAGLFEFNSFRNKLGRPIEIRAAIHTGSVLAPGQDIKSVNFAHVIDVAAHLQKVAPTGSLAVSEATAKYLPGGIKAFGDESVSSQDVTAAIWRPKRGVLPAALTPRPSE